MMIVSKRCLVLAALRLPFFSIVPLLFSDADDLDPPERG